MSDIKQKLEEFSLFHESDLRSLLSAYGQIASFKRSSLLMESGKYPKVLPLVLSGLIKVFRKESDKDIMLYYLRPLDSCIMTIHATMNHDKSAVSAIVEEDTEVLLIPTQYFPEWFDRYNSLQRFVLSLYQRKFDDLMVAFDAVVFQKADERLENFLLERFESMATHELHMTHQDVADGLGLARETASRLLKKLERDEKIHLTRGVIKKRNL
jgi:CRP/FNR family transcriptional regulator